MNMQFTKPNIAHGCPLALKYEVFKLICMYMAVCLPPFWLQESSYNAKLNRETGNCLEWLNVERKTIANYIGLNMQIWLTPTLYFTILLLHFMFFRLWGYPLTVAPFTVLCFILANYQLNLKETWRWAAFLLFLPFVGLIWSLAGGENPNIVEYFRTYSLWAYASLVLLVAVKSPILKQYAKHLSVEKISLVCMAILCAFSVAQVVMFAVWGYAILYNPFGNHQYLGQYEVARFANGGTIRAPGLYLEPSFNAFIIISLYVVCLLGKFKLLLSSALTLLALFVIQSMTGLIVFMVIWALILLNVQFERDLAVKRGWARMGAVNLMLALVVGYSGGVLGIVNSINSINNSSGGVNNAVSRLGELGVPSTSGHYRIVAPLRVLKAVLVDNPLGKPFGQIEETLSSYHLLHGTGFGTSLDNGVYLLVFYFGWLGIAFLSFLFFRMAKKVSSPSGLNELILLAFIFLSLLFSGGVMLPEYVLMLLMVLYQYRLSAFVPAEK